MRLNKYLALFGGMSRRSADVAIASGRVTVNGNHPEAGQQVEDTDSVTLDSVAITPSVKILTIQLNKPVGYVCSRDGQGNRTVYELLPKEYKDLVTVGRLDKNSSGLLLMTNDGQLAYELTHPKFQKQKTYKIALDKDLSASDKQKIENNGVLLEDGLSKLKLQPINQQLKEWKVVMSEGRNRQIRRTFEELGYRVVKLHRTHFGNYALGAQKPGHYITV